MDKPKHPERVVLELGDQQVVFVRVGDDSYEAVWDGERRPIQTIREETKVSEAVYRDPYESTRSESYTANIDPLLRCLELGAERTPLPRGVKLSAIDNWGHFRQNTFLKVSITIGESGKVEIDEAIGVQDESYY